jgi:hypothetical protein
LKETIKYYHLENYLFDEVTVKFKNQGFLDAFDFFCIISWKSNRPKPEIVRSLQEKFNADIKKAVEEFTTQLYKNKGSELLKLLQQVKGIGLAMASAILSVMDPYKYTIFDYRVCETLNNYKNIGSYSDIDQQWEKYLAYIEDVKKIECDECSLRDKDRMLWGKSFKKQLEKEIENNFNKYQK